MFSKSYSVLSALGGIAIGVLVCYVSYHLPEMVRGVHHIDYGVLRNLILCGVPVLMFGAYEERTRARS